MKRLFLALLFLFAFTLPAAAQSAQSCICTVNPCTLVADPYPPGTNQPTTCTVYDASGGKIASAPVVPSASIPLSNASSCVPADPTYNPGVAGSVSCSVPVGPYPLGNNLVFTMTATDATGESAKSLPLAFTNVTVLPPPLTIPTVPTKLRHAIYTLPDYALEGVVMALKPSYDNMETPNG